MKARKNPFPIKQLAMFTIRTKNPRFILSYGISLEGPTLKNLDMPKHAESTDKENVMMVCVVITPPFDSLTVGSFPTTTINKMRCTCGNDSRYGSENKEFLNIYLS